MPLAVPAAVTVAVTEVRSARGHVHVDLCPADRFLTANCPYSADAPARIGTTLVTVPGVPPGRYAAQAFHDENDNGRVDRLLGIPREGLGFSRDAPVRMAPPRFDDAAFDHGTVPQSIGFRLRYFLR